MGQIAHRTHVANFFATAGQCGMKTDEPSKRAWITGAGGLIGRYLAETKTADAARFDIIPLTRPMLDLTDFASVEKRFRAERPVLVIHCAAMSKNPDCQANPALAKKINVGATAHLAAL